MSKLKPLYLILGLLGILGHAGAWFAGTEYGKRKGVDMYHQQCYNIGGIIIDEEHGTVVKCAPLTSIPREEIERYKVLDKMLKM